MPNKDQKGNEGNESPKRKFTLNQLTKQKYFAQFTQGVEDFMQRYKTKADATEGIFQRFKAFEHQVCNDCGCDKFTRDYGEKFGFCKACGKKKSFFKGYPFLERMKKPLAYLCLIELLEKGYVFNTNQFAKALKIAYATAWNMRKKVEKALLQKLLQQKNRRKVSTSKYLRLFIKRSAATPAHQPPVAEQKAMEDLYRTKSDSDDKQKEDASSQDSKAAPDKSEAPTDKGETNTDTSEPGTETRQPAAKKDEPDVLTTLTTTQLNICDALRSGPQDFEALLETLEISVSELSSALMVLNLQNLITNLGGDRYEWAKSKATAMLVDVDLDESLEPDLDDQIDEEIDFIQQNCHGISRNYLPLFLADVWRTRIQNSEQDSISILETCLEFHDVCNEDVKAFRCPLQVEIIPAAA